MNRRSRLPASPGAPNNAEASPILSPEPVRLQRGPTWLTPLWRIFAPLPTLGLHLKPCMNGELG